jgi:hypothetical protein
VVNWRLTGGSKYFFLRPKLGWKFKKISKFWIFFIKKISQISVFLAISNVAHWPSQILNHPCSNQKPEIANEKINISVLKLMVIRTRKKAEKKNHINLIY